MYRVLAPVALAVGAVLHGCGGDDTTAAPPSPSPPSPGPAIRVEILQSEANNIIDTSAKWEEVTAPDGENFVFLEGPVWERNTSSWIWSDIPGNTQWQLVPGQTPTKFRNPSGKANGNWLLEDGVLLTCEHEGRAVVRFTLEGQERTPLATMFNDSNLTSPNDVAVRSTTGAIYFTDPSYGTSAAFGHGQAREQTFNNVFRLDRAGAGFVSEPVSVERELVEPNGIIFNPSETKVYVADSGSTPRNIWVYDVNAVDGSLENKTHFASPPLADGLRVDEHGNLWVAAAGGGVQIYNDAGTEIAKIHTDGTGWATSNLAFGGADGSDLMITGFFTADGQTFEGRVFIVTTKTKAAPPPAALLTQKMIESSVALV